jgi:hypothetical protein
LARLPGAWTGGDRACPGHGDRCSRPARTLTHGPNRSSQRRPDLVRYG